MMRRWLAEWRAALRWWFSDDMFSWRTALVCALGILWLAMMIAKAVTG